MYFETSCVFPCWFWWQLPSLEMPKPQPQCPSTGKSQCSFPGQSSCSPAALGHSYTCFDFALKCSLQSLSAFYFLSKAVPEVWHSWVLGCYLFFSYLRFGQILYFCILGTVMVTPFQQWSQMFVASVTVLSLGFGDQELSLGSCVALKCSLAGVVPPDSKGRQDTAVF